MRTCSMAGTLRRTVFFAACVLLSVSTLRTLVQVVFFLKCLFVKKDNGFLKKLVKNPFFEDKKYKKAIDELGIL